MRPDASAQGEGDRAPLARVVACMGRTVGALLDASTRAHDAVLCLAQGLRAHARDTRALERQLAEAEREASALRRALQSSGPRGRSRAARENACPVADGARSVEDAAGPEVDCKLGSGDGVDSELGSGFASVFVRTPSSGSTSGGSSGSACAFATDADPVTVLVPGPASVPASVTDSAADTGPGSAFTLVPTSDPAFARDFGLVRVPTYVTNPVTAFASGYAPTAASQTVCGFMSDPASGLVFAPNPASAVVSGPVSAPPSASSTASALATACDFVSEPPVAPGAFSGAVSSLASGRGFPYTLPQVSDRAPPGVSGAADGLASTSSLSSAGGSAPATAYYLVSPSNLASAFISGVTSGPATAPVVASGPASVKNYVRASEHVCCAVSAPVSASPSATRLLSTSASPSASAVASPSATVPAPASTLNTAPAHGSAFLPVGALNLHQPHFSVPYWYFARAAAAASVPSRTVGGSLYPTPNSALFTHVPTVARPRVAASVPHSACPSVPAPSRAFTPASVSAPASACNVSATCVSSSVPTGGSSIGCGDFSAQLPPRSVSPTSSSKSSAVATTPKKERRVRGEGAGRRALGKQLLRAAHEGRAADARRLLDAGASPNFTQGSLWTALHRAAWGGHAATVALLVASGGDVTARTAQGFTPLHVAAYNDPSGHCVDALLRAGADVHATNTSGWTPLHYAAECGNATTVRLLLAAGACPRARNRDDKTPADVARTQPVRLLLDAHLLHSQQEELEAMV